MNAVIRSLKHFLVKRVPPASPVPGGPGSRANTAMGMQVMSAGEGCGAEAAAPAGWNSELLHSQAELLAKHFTSLDLSFLNDNNKDKNGTYLMRLL